jgi:hypothetical protein
MTLSTCCSSDPSSIVRKKIKPSICISHDLIS